MGLSFYFLSDLQVISVLHRSGRTVYSNCQPSLAYDLKAKKVWFGLIWFGLVVFTFSCLVFLVLTQVSLGIKFL